MRERKADPDKITALVKAGLTNAQIAEELDVVPGTVRHWVRTLGLAGNREVYRSIRDRAEDMPPTRAKDYLLDALMMLHEAMVLNAEHEVDTWGIHLTPTERRILICLVDARGAVRTKEQVMAAIYFGARDAGPESKTLDVLLCKLRKRLPASIGHIKTEWGVGLRWVAA